MSKGFPQGPPITDYDREIFRREWERGTPFKLIAQMLDPPRTVKALIAWRRDMKLPRRQRSSEARAGAKVIHINFELPVAFKEELQHKAREQRLTVSAYIRKLISQDLIRR